MDSLFPESASSDLHLKPQAKVRAAQRGGLDWIDISHVVKWG